MFHCAVYRLYLVAALIVAIWIGVPEYVLGQGVAKETPPHSIVKVVLEEGEGTFTHGLHMKPGERLRLAVNADDVDEKALKVNFSPADEFLVIDPETLLNRRASRLYPDVLKFGEGGDVDFNVENVWKLLLGEEVTLVVKETKQSSSGGGNRAGRTETEDSEGAESSEPEDRSRITGKFLGYGKEGDAPRTLKILAGEDNELLEVSEDAIVSLDFPDALSNDLKKALAILRKSSGADRRALVIERVHGGVQQGDLTVTYTYKTSPWGIKLQGEHVIAGDDETGDKLSVKGWARIRNETLYDWNRVDVTLKTDKGKYSLGKISLARQQSGWFPITFVAKGRGNGKATTSTSVVLQAKRRNEIEISADATVKDKKISCQDVLNLSNASDYSIPAGELTLGEWKGSKKLQVTKHEVTEMPPDGGKKAVPLEVGTKKDVAAVWTKTAATVGVVGVQGRFLNCYSGHRSTLKFKSPNGLVEAIHVTIGKAELDLKLKASGGQSVAKAEEVYVRLPDLGKDRVRGTAVATSNATDEILYFERQKSAEPKDMFKLPVKELADLQKLATADETRAAIELVSSDLKTIRSLEKAEKGLVAEIKKLEEQEQFYLGQIQSSSHGPIYRRLATLMQQKEQQLAIVRRDLAVARFKLDHDTRDLAVPVASSGG